MKCDQWFFVPSGSGKTGRGVIDAVFAQGLLVAGKN
jgi:hypothetical protein